MTKEEPHKKLSQETLEQILIAIRNAKNDRGLVIHLPPNMVLQDWVMEQLPNGGRGQSLEELNEQMRLAQNARPRELTEELRMQLAKETNQQGLTAS